VEACCRSKRPAAVIRSLSTNSWPGNIRLTGTGSPGCAPRGCSNIGLRLMAACLYPVGGGAAEARHRASCSFRRSAASFPRWHLDHPGLGLISAPPPGPADARLRPGAALPKHAGSVAPRLSARASEPGNGRRGHFDHPVACLLLSGLQSSDCSWPAASCSMLCRMDATSRAIASRCSAEEGTLRASTQPYPALAARRIQLAMHSERRPERQSVAPRRRQDRAPGSTPAVDQPRYQLAVICLALPP
jgi:hypothetical protein